VLTAAFEGIFSPAAEIQTPTRAAGIRTPYFLEALIAVFLAC
jgi:hypothetical protein